MVKNKPYVSAKKIIGPGGPCSFINLTGLKGSPRFEKKLSEIGRLKPFHASTYSAFLEWAEKYKWDLTIYTKFKKLNNKMFNLMFFYEKTPKNLQGDYKKKAIKLIEKRNRKYASKIKLLISPINKLNELLKNDYKVAVLTSSYYLKKPRVPVSHWIVAYKRIGNKYYFMDSAKKNGKTILTKEDLIKGFRLNKKIGFCPQLVSYKSKQGV